MGKNTEDNDEHNCGWNPGPEFVGVNNFVAEECDEQRADGNDDDAGIAWHVVIDSVDQFGTDNGVYSRPTQACKDVENGDLDMLVLDKSLELSCELTDLHTMPSKPVSRQDHLPQPKTRSESREVTHRNYANQIEE